MSLIINAVGQDRCGLVSEITGFVIHEGGNVGESQASKLGKYFSLMMLVEVPRQNLDSLQERLRGMNHMNATVFEANAEDAVSSSQTKEHGCKSWTRIGCDDAKKGEGLRDMTTKRTLCSQQAFSMLL